MEYRDFGTTGLKISPVCMGTVFRGDPEETIRKATIERAIDLGINFIDCANTYQDGRSEQMVGDVLKGRQRDQFVVTTKVCEPVGEGPNDRGLSRGHILREIDNSLTRLQMDYVDIYLLHHPDPTTPIEETLDALNDLVHQGRVRYVGCCNFSAWQVCKAHWVSDQNHLVSFMCVQNPYNLISRSLEEEMMPFCRSEGVGIMVYSPLSLGLLSGCYRLGIPPPTGTYWANRPNRFNEKMTPEIDGVVDKLGHIADARGKTIAQTAMAWILSHPEISAVITGPDTPVEVEENVGATGWMLTDDERAALDEVSTGLSYT